jgi:hypothetical protein
VEEEHGTELRVADADTPSSVPGKAGTSQQLNLSIHPHANARAVAVTRALIPSAQVLGPRVGDTGRSFSRCAPRWCFVPVRTRRVYDAVLVSSSPASPPPHYARSFLPSFPLVPPGGTPSVPYLVPNQILPFPYYPRPLTADQPQQQETRTARGKHGNQKRRSPRPEEHAPRAF